MKARALSIGSAVLVFLAVALTAHADGQCPAGVAKAFKGQIIVSDGPLQQAGSDKDTIKAYKAQRLTAVKGHENGDDVLEWTFNVTAFLKSKGHADLTLQFYKGDAYVADRRLNGVDPTTPIVDLAVQINEDDGPSKGDYTLKLVAVAKGKELVVASTALKLE